MIELDRGSGRVYKPNYKSNYSPTLKTGNRYLFVLSTADLDKPDHEKEFCRWLMPYERPALQGMSPDVSLALSSQDLIHATGN